MAWSNQAKKNAFPIFRFPFHPRDIFKGQKVVSLSTAEAEFYACAEAVKEVPFIAQILLFLGISVELPIRVRVDNVGAIFMSDSPLGSVIVESREGGVGYHRCSHRG